MAFLLGSYGIPEDVYALEYAKMVSQKGWRFVVLNRRGWDRIPIKSDMFMHQDESRDFYEAIVAIYDIYRCPIFLCGVSAGANHGAKLVADYGEKLPIQSFVSISNPFNFAKLAFKFSRDILGVFISKQLLGGAKKVY